MRCRITIVRGTLIIMGQHSLPKRCSTTFAWTAHIDIIRGLGFDLCPLPTIESKKQYEAQAILQNWLTVSRMIPPFRRPM